MSIGTFAGPSDGAAARLLRCAAGAMQKWPELFRGFRATVRACAADSTAVGAVTVRPGGEITVVLDHDELHALTAAFLCRLTLDCTPCFFCDGLGRFPLSLDADGPSGAERRIHVHRPDGLPLSYCLDRAGRIRSEEYVTDGIRTVVAIEEFRRANPGRVLPARTRTTRWDAANGALLGSELIADQYTRLDFVWLPAARHVTTSRITAGDTALLEFADHALL